MSGASRTRLFLAFDERGERSRHDEVEERPRGRTTRHRTRPRRRSHWACRHRGARGARRRGSIRRATSRCPSVRPRSPCRTAAGGAAPIASSTSLMQLAFSIATPVGDRDRERQQQDVEQQWPRAAEAARRAPTSASRPATSAGETVERLVHLLRATGPASRQHAPPPLLARACTAAATRPSCSPDLTMICGSERRRRPQYRRHRCRPGVRGPRHDPRPAANSTWGCHRTPAPGGVRPGRRGDVDDRDGVGAAARVDERRDGHRRSAPTNSTTLMIQNVLCRDRLLHLAGSQ